ncbi:PGPGW domain-containing protein [Actinomadura roseirufa]|uniref:PGPGW domain-containing protein n=1 Tax=Actinomadura roseirufa TaxID=2094049 RepID=UPI001041ABAC|nr:PGPGW domain-containing protein [Actinomadura roseirufa]
MAINHEKDAPPDKEPGPFHRFRERVRRNAVLNTAWRAGVFTVGAAVLVGGLIMMVTPGPGLVAIVLGLAILATEFTWAKRALHRAKDAAERAKNKALDPRKKARNSLLALAGAALATAAVVAYLVLYGLVLPWNIEDPTFWN